MNALWITLALLTAGFVGWPVTSLVFRLARTIDDRTLDGQSTGGSAGVPGPDAGAAEDPSADSTTDPEIPAAAEASPGAAAQGTGDATQDHATQDRATQDQTADANQDPAADSVSSARILRGGAIIGVLERFAVCLAILAGQPVAIAYVVAIKGLGRFAELKGTPVAAERFIIGTLTSMLWAAGVAALTKVLVFG
ncbi:hypothetical protein [Arthrobacter sp. ov118]|uniref:hypothetical protein n=1 Tax=Arthrobacter sp. ov118 TaxID=1761747 RepID=UPI0008EE23EF|nr:hypothetical protein [Arthrobacter sp. ov118]SFU05699.1 hypothetical protein SAMN04487915_10983 [Arthrobacter sp. ov118]